MRLRLGLLQDPAVIERQIAREAAEAQARKHQLEAPTVRSEAEMKAYEAETAEERKKAKERTKPRVRPLSETKAIDMGANFVSESFLFLVGVAIIAFEYSRRERKESSRREDVADRIQELEDTEKISQQALVDLEKEVIRLRALKGEKPTKTRILPKELWEVDRKEETEEQEKGSRWLSWIPGFRSRNDPSKMSTPASDLKASPQDSLKNAKSSSSSSDTAPVQDEQVSKSSTSGLQSKTVRETAPNSAS